MVHYLPIIKSKEQLRCETYELVLSLIGLIFSRFVRQAASKMKEGLLLRLFCSSVERWREILMEEGCLTSCEEELCVANTWNRKMERKETGIDFVLVSKENRK